VLGTGPPLFDAPDREADFERIRTVTAPSTYLALPTANADQLRATFQPIFDKIAEGNVAREQDRVLPHEQVRWLINARFATLRVPAARGGFGASLQQVFELLALLGAADANVSHIWRNHLAFVEDRLNAPVSPANDRWLGRILAGDFVGGGWTEADNGTLDNIKTHLVQAGDHWEITGRKFYATGSLYADWLDVLGLGPDGTPLTALVRVKQPGVELIDDWPGFGQRTTASGSANYTSALIEEGDLIPLAERNASLAPFYQIAMLAVLAGITGAALRDGVDALRARQRNYRHALAKVPAQDPQLQQVLGRISALSFGAHAALDRAAGTLDDIVAAKLGGLDETALKDLLIKTSIATSQAQIVIIDAALEAATTVFDALGASGTYESARLDRHWRNARTLASHNPRVYKERIIGDWLINGADPIAAVAGLGAQPAADAGPATTAPGAVANVQGS
jgi:alkylation response protein AidB-like acyl-CoA dehydrogenase